MAWMYRGAYVMNGTEFLADTNAVIYLLSGNKCQIPRDLQHEQAWKAGLDYNGSILLSTMPGE